MAGFEQIVRPMILPNIRPAPRPSVVLAEADPDKGLVVIRGASAKTIELPFSYSVQWQVTVPPEETEREYDVVRVYQSGKDTSGEGASTRGINARSGEDDINRDNYVDVEVVKRLKMQMGSDGDVDHYYAPVEASDNTEILERDQVRRR